MKIVSVDRLSKKELENAKERYAIDYEMSMESLGIIKEVKEVSASRLSKKELGNVI